MQSCVIARALKSSQMTFFARKKSAGAVEFLMTGLYRLCISPTSQTSIIIPRLVDMVESALNCKFGLAQNENTGAIR